MKVFVIDRMDRYSYCDNYKAVVVAEDALHAEKYARMNVYGFKKAKLKVTEISLDSEQILSVENTGHNMNEILENEMILVKNLGNRIGYGNLMSWASALWRKELVDNGCSKELAELSVFVPVSIADVKDKRISEIKASESIYDSYIEEYIK